MADTNETITDIIRKIRSEADSIEESARGSLKAGENYDGIAFTESDLESALDLAETKRKEADRLDAAHKRERGDVAKLREALGKLRAELWNNTVIAGKRKFELYEIADAALAVPPRNCDAGTVEEQSARFRKFCKKGSMDNFEATAYCAYECPCGNNYDCKLAWAQMPYEKGCADER